MGKHFDDTDTVIFDDLEEDRVHEVDACLSKAVSAGNDRKVKVSVLDMFDLERISLLRNATPRRSQARNSAG